MIDKIKIGCLDYEVKKTNEILVVDNRVCKGRISFEKQIIELSDDEVQSEQGRELTFWHEVVHGIVRERGLEWGANDEFYTEELARGIYALMKDNKFPLPGQEVTL